MKLRILLTTFGLMGVLLSAPMALAGDGDVAKVIIIKGKAQGTKADGTVIGLAKGTWLPEGVKVSTEAKSFVKLLFIDKSTMNVGPKSEMEITKFPKKKAGVISLLKGSVRSKVTKNYMEMADKDKSKLFIKTKSAAMGVRGTDFQVDFNPATAATNLTTFEGSVAMVPLDNLNLGGDIQGSLDVALNSPSAVMVNQGMESSATGGQAAPPSKVPDSKLQQMKNDPKIGSNSNGDGNKEEGPKKGGLAKGKAGGAKTGGAGRKPASFLAPGLPVKNTDGETPFGPPNISGLPIPFEPGPTPPTEDVNPCDVNPEICDVRGDGGGGETIGTEESIEDEVLADILDEINNEIQTTTVQFIIQ